MTEKLHSEQGVYSEDQIYVQQHLANERTFLAWVRTGTAIIGLGFLAAGLVFNSSANQEVIHKLAAFTGITSVLLGVLVILFAAKDYYIIQRGIREQKFRPRTTIIMFVFASLTIIGCALIALISMLMMWN
ncbi:YidH family protein [Paenibacillus gansuensis]|uniref:YidH family protein n=1 Tax=Paenibacillus gansuensis TaxID=306542 RepID=A0ABW5PER1_9BACL